MVDKRKRIGILGGTFNPIHLGHLMIAEMALEAFGLNRVIFVPAKEPPHKETDVIESKYRLEMVRAAVLDNPNFVVSDVEMQREGKSYTIDTLRYFHDVYGPTTEFFFIAGTDTIQNLPTWKYIEELLDMCEFIGAIRPGATDDIGESIEWFGQRESRIHILEVPEMKLSATDLRHRLRHGLSTRYMLPRSVYQYIKEHKIYNT
ncbi:nicotinate-nucleotide adenylyltransferase [Veillonella sp. VA142]|uniref:nicotinate-nucleotide adenylyltransferase n=1 Tax=Veillonella sp. VA142 TaxID=741834 RepID=UPI000F8EB28B|nr:nicotinate-nucleotide adenylyltransferase [Veillonella sp. VA142]